MKTHIYIHVTPLGERLELEIPLSHLELHWVLKRVIDLCNKLTTY